MQDTELFLSLAEIAGVFVGFGALIAIRGGGTMRTFEITDLRWVMSTAIWVVIAALVPVFVNGYGVTGHELWLACSVLALALYAVIFFVNGLAPESLEERAATFASTRRARVFAVAVPTVWLPVACLVLALVLVVLGVAPDREQPLYLTAVGLGLLMSALGLFVAVFYQRPASKPRGG